MAQRPETPYVAAEAPYVVEWYVTLLTLTSALIAPRGELPGLEPLDKISLNDSPDWQASGDFRDFFQGRDAALSFVGVDSNTGPVLVFIMPSTQFFALSSCFVTLRPFRRSIVLAATSS